MTDIPPPEWIKYCPLCMARHNAGFPMGNRYPVQGRCSSCGQEIKERKNTRIASVNCYRFFFDEIIESQIDDKHKKLCFDSKKDAYDYAVETWGSDVANNYITIQEFSGEAWRTINR